MRTLIAMLLIATLGGCSTTPAIIKSHDYQGTWVVDEPVDDVLAAYKRFAEYQYTGVSGLLAPRYSYVRTNVEVEDDLEVCSKGQFGDRLCGIYITLNEVEGKTVFNLWAGSPIARHQYTNHFKAVKIY